MFQPHMKPLISLNYMFMKIKVTQTAILVILFITAVTGEHGIP